MEGHHIFDFEGGPELAEMLLAEKGATLETSRDIHSVTAVKLGITRDNAKSINYALLYGAQWPKLVKMLNITDEEAKDLYNRYWDALPALKELKQRVENFWKDSHTDKTKRFIRAIDGRKILIRSEHSLLNFLFQGNGAIMSKWSAVRIAEEFDKQNLLGDPFKHTEEDVKVWQMILYHDEVQYAIHRNLMRVKIFPKDTEEEEADFTKRKEAYALLSEEEKITTSKPMKAQSIKEAEFRKSWTDTQLADTGHLDDGRSYIGLAGTFSDTLLKGVKVACDEQKLKVPLGISWVTGSNW